MATVDRGRGLRKGAAGGLLRGEGQRSDIAGNSRSTVSQGPRSRGWKDEENQPGSMRIREQSCLRRQTVQKPPQIYASPVTNPNTNAKTSLYGALLSCVVLCNLSRPATECCCYGPVLQMGNLGAQAKSPAQGRAASNDLSRLFLSLFLKIELELTYHEVHKVRCPHKKKPIPISSHHPLPSFSAPSLWQPLIYVPSLWIFACSGHSIEMESYIMWPSVSGFFHSA